jgi:PEP-CTERM motif
MGAFAFYNFEATAGNVLVASVSGVSAVPEPATWAMMLLGFAGLGFAFRQTRRKVSFAQVTGHTKVRRDRRCGGLFFSDSHGRSAVNISSIANGALGEQPPVGTEVTALGSLTPQSLAKLLMWELSNETECCG